MELISAEKAEVIIRRHRGSPQSAAAKRVIADVARQRGAKLIDVEQEYQVSGAQPGPGGTSFSVSRVASGASFTSTCWGCFKSPTLLPP